MRKRIPINPRMKHWKQKSTKSKEILHLLLIEDGDKNHLCLIKNISRLTNHLNTTNKKDKTYCCEYCNNFTSFIRDKLIYYDP